MKQYPVTQAFLIFFATLFIAVPLIAYAQSPCTPGYAGDTLCNAFGGTTDAKDLFGKAFTFIGEVIGLAAITMMVYSGARLITANGNPDTIKTAKSGFAWAIGGFAIAVLAYVVVLATENFIGVQGVDRTARHLQNPLSNNELRGFMGNILNGFGVVVGLLAVFMIVVNGFRYVTAGGNEEAATKAKSGVLWSVVGLIGISLAYVIIRSVAALLG